uniref:ATP synthase complex subunit 8 n=1 Tax=Calotes mystaceus TaxID=118097 RepID=A0A7M4CJ93_9SAUR|nr:ATP synthase F0 subunit 8 [Calotes mystaceus]QOQ85764.1 ATP synthase F0 subunit 8 [Calotes mystaceus]
MPQMNPDTWFSMMILTWLFFLTMITKISDNTPILPPKKKEYPPTKDSWTWPWN